MHAKNLAQNSAQGKSSKNDSPFYVIWSLDGENLLDTKQAMVKNTTMISKSVVSQNVVNYKIKFQNGNKQKSIPNRVKDINLKTNLK